MLYNTIEAITKRRSVRTFTASTLKAEDRETLLAYGNSAENPFGPSPRIAMIDKSVSAEGEKLGTYGFVKNATLFAAFACADTPAALLGVGYVGETMMLRAVSMGYGAVWLGGTFRKSAFAAAMHLSADEVLPAIFPIGTPAPRRMTEKIMRKIAKSDSRKPWNELFFIRDFRTPLTPHEADSYAEAFELMRMAPSAVNAQPWRALVTSDAIHFYLCAKEGISEADMRLKYIDMGIALCHFSQAAAYRGLASAYTVADPAIASPYRYIASIKL